MSSLKENYNELTRIINQGVFNAEEHSLIDGRLYGVGIIDIPFGIGVVVDLLFDTATLIVLMNEYSITSTSEDVLIESFIGTQYSGGSIQPVYSNNDLVEIPSSVAPILNPTIDVLGTKNRPDVVFRGIAGQGSRVGLAATNGSPLYIYAPDQVHHFKFTNRGSAAIIDIHGSFGELINIT